MINYNVEKTGLSLQKRIADGETGKFRVKIYTTHSEQPMVEDLTVEQLERFSWFKWITLIELDVALRGGIEGVAISSDFKIYSPASMQYESYLSQNRNQHKNKILVKPTIKVKRSKR
jgi:hypothetical protein